MWIDSVFLVTKTQWQKCDLKLSKYFNEVLRNGAKEQKQNESNESNTTSHDIFESFVAIKKYKTKSTPF